MMKSSLWALLCLIFWNYSLSLSPKSVLRVRSRKGGVRNGQAGVLSASISGWSAVNDGVQRRRKQSQRISAARLLSTDVKQQDHRTILKDQESAIHATLPSPTRHHTPSSAQLSPAQIRSLPPDGRFQYRLEQLQLFHQSHGHFDVPRKYDFGLSNWVSTQRYEYRRELQRKKSLLTPARIQQLNKLQFDWKENTQGGLTREWMIQFRNLERFREEHGHVQVRVSEHGSFGKWFSNQRYQYQRLQRGVKPCSMTPQRIKLLESVGMVWDARGSSATKHDEKWMQRYEEMCEFQLAHGHCRVAGHHKPLGPWAANQRKAYRDRLKYKVSSLTERREELLRKIGFELEAGHRWEPRFQDLVEFERVHGHTRVLQSQNASLYRWILRQRKEYKQWKKGELSSMTPDCINRLEEIGFEWDGTVGRPRKAS